MTLGLLICAAGVVAHGLKLPRDKAGATSVGLISDTHGLTRPEALAALAGSAHIVCRGDIGDPAVLEALRRIAPVTAVRGNNDFAPWAKKLRDTELLEIASTRRDPRPLGARPGPSSGRNRRRRLRPFTPSCRGRARGVLYVNPGSAGPRQRLPSPWPGSRCARKVVFRTL